MPSRLLIRIISFADKYYCHMVYYIKNWEAIFDAFKKIRQIDGKLRAMTFFPRDFLVQ